MPETKLQTKIYIIIGVVVLALLAYSNLPAKLNPVLAVNTLISTPATGYFPSASLVNDSGTIFFIYGTTKIPFTNFAAFKGLGYSLNNVRTGNLSGYSLSTNYQISTANAAHPWGSWLIIGGTIYYSANQGLIGVPSVDIFLANTGAWNLVVKANSYDLAILNNSPHLPPLLAADPRIFGPSNPTSQPAVISTSVSFSILPAMVPVTISTSSPAQALPSSQLAQCGNDMNCFITDAQICKPAEVTQILNLTRGSLVQSMQSDLQIQGQQSGKCQFYQNILSASQSYTDSLKTKLQANGMSADQISQAEQFSNQQAKTIIGDITLCQYVNSDLVTLLKDWQQNNFTDNLPNGNCQVNMAK